MSDYLPAEEPEQIAIQPSTSAAAQQATPVPVANTSAPRAPRGRPPLSRTTLKAPSSRKSVPKNTPEYRDKRDRNNEAVRKSRAKAKQKEQATAEEINKLKAENKQLVETVTALQSELATLKNLMSLSLSNHQ